MRKQIESLQILRAIAFLEIFLGHCGITFFTGAFGVSIFIVLSGFCMALNYLPKADKISLSPVSNIKYALLKIKKLYSLHIIMLVAAFLLAKMPTSAEAIKRLVMDVLLVQSLSPHSADFFSYNGVAWYLSTYLFICIFSLYIIKMISKCKNKKMAVVSGIFVYSVMILIGLYVSNRPITVGDNFAFWFTYIFPGYRLLEFFLGSILGWLYMELKQKNHVGKISATVLEICAVILFVVVILVFHKMEGVYDGLCYTALFTPISILFVAVFAGSNGLVMRILNNPVLLWLGNLSTYTFLIHQVVIRWLRDVLGNYYVGECDVLLVTIISFTITAVVAMLVQYIGKTKNRKYIPNIN